ncbi:MAG: copper resistance protein CopD, partial [Planctomycetota bacterium]
MPTHSILLFLHVLGACVWFGGHVVISFLILPKAKKAQDPRILVDFEQSFERIGLPALVVQALTGPYLALRYAPMGDWFLWQNETQDHIASKLLVLGIIVALAVHMKLKVLPRLRAGEVKALRPAAG